MDFLIKSVQVANDIFDYYGKWYRLIDIFKILTASDLYEKIAVSMLVCVIVSLVLFNKVTNWRRLVIKKTLLPKQRNAMRMGRVVSITEDDSPIELIEVRDQLND